MLAAWRPVEPVYCIYPEMYLRNARQFLSAFPGRVLYAVKVNDDPQVLSLLYEAGVRHYDCASLPEIELVHATCPGATSYFMIPVWLRNAPRRAFQDFGVRHFVIDHPSGLEALATEVPMDECVVFVRMGISHASAMNDLSRKFGASADATVTLLQAVASSGAEPALAFNVGSAVTDPQAYAHAMDLAAGVLERVPLRIRLLDIGGGYPFSYPGFEVPPLDDYWRTIAEHASALRLAENGELLTEPGRALAAPGLSAVVEVLQRKEDRLYLNDGGYGIFWELRFKGHDRYPARAFRDAEPLQGEVQEFSLFGPTCDAFDALPGKIHLPADLRPGDYLEFGHIGAYSLAGRTRFNGHYSDRIVTLDGSWP